MPVCRDCHGMIALPRTNHEDRLLQNNLTRVCKSCQNDEEARHPNGYKNCNCESTTAGEWKCYSCRMHVYDRISFKGINRETQLRRVRRDHQGQIICDLNRPERNSQACRCGRYHRNNSRNVLHCLGCEGIIVQAQSQSTLRRSSKIRAKNMARPAPDYTSIVILDRRGLVEMYD